MVEIVVGKNAAVWHLHQALLCSTSRSFDAVINSLFREGREKKVVMADEDNAVFTLFVQWLYTKAFSTVSSWELIRAYVLGDRLQAEGFRTTAMNKLYTANAHKCTCTCTCDQVLSVAENTILESALRRLTADSIAYGMLTKSLGFSEEEKRSLAPISADVMRSIDAMIPLQDLQGNRVWWPRLDVSIRAERVDYGGYSRTSWGVSVSER